MKLLSLRLQNFGCHVDTTIDLGILTYIFGLNNSGKSGLAPDAIRYALTGRARCTDAGGKGAKALVRTGAGEMRVCLGFEHAGNECTLIRTCTADGSGKVSLEIDDGTSYQGRNAEARLEVLLGAPADLIDAALEVTSWFSLTPARQSELLQSIAKVKYTLAEIEGEARPLGLPDAAVATMIGGIGRRAAGREEISPAVLEASYEAVYEKRAETKKLLASLEAKFGALPSGSTDADQRVIDAGKAEVERLDLLKGEIQRRIGEARAKCYQAGQYLQQLQNLKAPAFQPPPKAPQLTLAPTEASVEELEATFADLERTRQVMEKQWNEAVEALRQARTAHDEIESRIRAANGSTICPSIHKPAECPLSAQLAKSLQAQLPALAKKETASHRTLDGAEDTAKRLAENLEAASKEIENARRSVNQAKAAQATAAAVARTAAAKDDEAREERLAIVETSLRDLGDPQADLSAAERELFATDDLLRAARQQVLALETAQRQAGERGQLQQEIAAKREDVAIYDAITKALDPKALPARLLATKVGLIEAAINDALQHLTGGAYGVEINAADKGLRLDIQHRGVDGDLPIFALPIANLSSSEKLRIGVALGCALSRLTDLGILVIDNADILDAGNRALLADAVLEMGMESTVVIATREDVPFGSVNGVNVYWIADGTAERVEASEEVTA